MEPQEPDSPNGICPFCGDVEMEFEEIAPDEYCHSCPACGYVWIFKDGPLTEDDLIPILPPYEG